MSGKSSVETIKSAKFKKEVEAGEYIRSSPAAKKSWPASIIERTIKKNTDQTRSQNALKKRKIVRKIDSLKIPTRNENLDNKAEIGSVCRQCMHPDGTSGTDFKQIVDATGDTGLTLAKWMEETLDYSIYGEATMRKIGDGLK